MTRKCKLSSATFFKKAASWIFLFQKIHQMQVSIKSTRPIHLKGTTIPWLKDTHRLLEICRSICQPCATQNNWENSCRFRIWRHSKGNIYCSWRKCCEYVYNQCTRQETLYLLLMPCPSMWPKQFLVSPKWFWFDQIDLDFTIMIWSQP